MEFLFPNWTLTDSNTYLLLKFAFVSKVTSVIVNWFMIRIFKS